MSFMRTLVKDYGWIHLGVGMAGNICFFVGSLLFLSESTKEQGVWLFLSGSGGMLIGSAGRLATSLYQRNVLDHHDKD